MQTISYSGAPFTPQLFIKIFAEARKLSPTRFMTLRLHPDRYKELYVFADVPESIQLGPVLLPLGRYGIRVNCIRPAIGIGDGITIREDVACPIDQMIFEIHGQPELVVKDIGNATH